MADRGPPGRQLAHENPVTGRDGGSRPPIFDAHAHLVSDDFRRYPLADQAAPSWAGRFPPPGAAGLRERVSRHPYTAEAVLREWDDSGVAAGAAVQYRTAYGQDNSYILDSGDAYPERVAPVVVLDAADRASAGQLAVLARHRGAAGVRLTGPADGGTLPWLDPGTGDGVWGVAGDLGLTVVIMYIPPGPSPDALARIAAVASAFPGTSVVIDHMGWPDFAGALGTSRFGLTAAHLALARLRNVHLKLTTITLEDLAGAGISAAGFVRYAADAFGADHLLWGSDAGNSQGAYPGLVSRAVAAAAQLTEAERAQFLGGTGRGLFVRGGRAASGAA